MEGKWAKYSSGSSSDSSDATARGRTTSRGLPRDDDQHVERRRKSPGGSVERTRDIDDEIGDQIGVRGSCRPKLEFCRTKPENVESKKGSSGDPVNLIVNYFSIQRKKDASSGGAWRLYQYHVDYEPEVESKSLRRGLLKSIQPEFGPNICIDGTAVYTSRRIPGEQQEITKEVQNQRDQTPYKLKIRLVKELNPTDSMYITFYNILMKKCQQLLKLTEMGRNFYDPAQKKPYPQHKLELYPGFNTTLGQNENSPLLCVEAIHKVIRTETLLQILEEFRQQSGMSDEMKRKAESEVLGAIVMTEYNKRTYRIDEIAWNRRPTETFETKKGPITFVEYYKTKYGLDLNPLQPLVVSLPKKKDIHRGNIQPFVLIPQYCRMTGLTDKIRSNFTIMKDLNQHLQMVPEKRVQAITGFVQRLNSDEETKTYLNNWGLRVSPTPLTIQGRVMPKEKLSFGGQDPIFMSDEKADWTMAFRSKPMLKNAPLQKWAIIVPDKDVNGVDNLVNTMQKVARPLQFQLARPCEIKRVRNPNPKEYTEAIQRVMSEKQGKLDMIFIILPNNKLPLYQAVKKLTYLDYGLPSQCFLAKNIQSKGLMSIATKCIIQMNAKLSGVPWSIDVPLKNMMIVGFDVYHGDTGANKGKTVGAMVATMTKNATKYYSTTSYHAHNEELSHNMCLNMTKCLSAYKSENGQLPGRIIFYRDGVGSGQLQYVYATELENLKLAIKSMYGSEKLEMPALTFIVCTKKISTRIMLPRGPRVDNPTPGTVVDDVITLPERYDFFIVAQAVRQATVSPTSYNVIFDTSGLDPDKLQRMTYKLCHSYYNWSGTVAVPAPVLYAHKLAFLTGTALGSPAHPSLNNRLYYL